MIKKKNFNLVLSLVFVLLFLNFFSAYMSSNTQTTLFSTSTSTTDSSCENQGSDFLIQISPSTCTPSVVRTDLLEENDVSVYCQLGATQINPLIDVKAIDSVSFSGKYSSMISGIGFHPSQSALGVKDDLNNPILDNIGYVVIKLKKQTNSSAIPDYVSGNLTAKISYDLKDAYGIGNALFYLSDISDSDWAVKKSQYSFWGGKGYIRADSISNTGADISVYTDSGLLSSVELEKGETSNSIYLPGFDCDAGLKIKLDSLNNPDTRAHFKINSEIVEVAKGEKFLENKCSVTNLKTRGLIQQVDIKCTEDSKVSSFSLSYSPKLILNIDEVENSFEVGDKLYETSDGKVFLGYIGITGNSKDKENLFVYLISTPLTHADSLTESELSSITSLVGDLINAKATTSGIVSKTTEAIKKVAGLSNLLSRREVNKELFYRINFGDGENVFGESVSIADFAEAQDSDLLDGDLEEYYNNAMGDYEKIINSFSTESYTTGITYGEEALYKEIELNSIAGQKKTASDLCDKFLQDYPNSKLADNYCNDYQLSNEDSNGVFVTINGEIKEISFEGIYEPTPEEYGATIMTDISGTTESYDLTKNRIIPLNYDETDYLQLISLVNETSVQVKVSISSSSKIIQLNKDTTSYFDKDNKYAFTLSNINLKKTAKVSITPNLKSAGTSANFSFKIGIEKRAIELSPDKTRTAIEKLNNSIKTWGKISSALRNVTQGLQVACLATGTGLVIKNFFTNLGGEGIARQSIMTGINGWTEKCEKYLSAGTYSSASTEAYSSLDDCFTENADEIDSEVGNLTKIISNQNTNFASLEKGITTTEFLSESVVNTDKLMEKYVPQVTTYLEKSSGFASALSSGTETINSEEILTILSEGYSKKIYTLSDLKEIELYAKVLDDSSSSEELKATAISRLYSALTDVKTNSGNLIKIDKLANSVGVDSDKIGYLEVSKDVKTVEYKGLTLGETGKTISIYSSTQIPIVGYSSTQISMSSSTPVYLAQASDSKEYLFILDNSAGTSKLTIKRDASNNYLIYDYSTMKLVETPSNFLTNIVFQKYDSASYKNKYTNAKLTYYETEPYAGLPAVVPFDLENGWYAAVKQTLAVGNNIASYDSSARVTSFYLCNVGENGLEENIGGDDECRSVNTGTGEPYDQFPGITDETKAKKLVDCAVDAVEQASKAYPASGKVSIKTDCGGSVSISVGSPAVDTPEFQCQNFMSPKDCLLLFNVCDPVLCPSSRCNLGGTYTVQDVVQSGVIGSIVLCFPNYKEGILMPVCLTGVKAGVDGFLSIQKSLRDCLQENLDTGKTVGICDEASSIYLCDLFWKESASLTNIVLPKIVSALSGQNARGGGEYLGIANAFSVAKDSVSYMANYYSPSTVQAFISKTTETAQTEICNSFVSGVFPSGADLVSSLTTVDSPVQFTGNFEEATLTTATVPPTSHYKVYYHIYAGENSGAYYKVYLKGLAESSYYKDTSTSITIASGYVSVGDYASETIDKIATSGYKQLCIDVNGDEECGFQEVSTSFAIDYLTDSYVSSQANETDITSESDCVSGTASLYNVLLNLNAQAAVESLINPSIYNNGIIRICATANPGKGTDPYYGTEDSRWVDVGYCGDENMRCWIDTDSVANTIEITTIENATLNSLSETYAEVLANEEGYLTDSQFNSAQEEIQNEEDPSKRINLIDEIIENVFMSNQKVWLYYWRGNAYTELFGKIWDNKKLQEELDKQNSAGEKIWEVANSFADQNWEETRLEAGCTTTSNCYDNVCARFVLRVLVNSGVTTSEIVGLRDSKISTITFDDTSWSKWENVKTLVGMFKDNSKDFKEITDFTKLEKGDIVILGLRESSIKKDDYSHVLIFEEYSDDTKISIRGYGEPGSENTKGKFVRIQTSKISILTSQTGNYVYKVYRYTGELESTKVLSGGVH